VPTRAYTLGPAFAPLLGYIGKITQDELRANPQASYLDETGKAGLEKQYNDTLQGTDGYRDVEHDVFNRATNILRRQDPIPGKTLRLTIDQELQTRLYNSLSQAVSKAHSTGGAAVAVDPRNGEVLAMVSAPTFDNNWFIDDSKKKERQNAVVDSRKLMLNRAIAGQYPSGSIIKPLISAAALAEKIITPSTTILSTGGLKIGPNYFPDWKSGGHGVTNVAKAIAESVNTFYYEIGGGYENQPGLGVL
jgi:penicillin-binding protein 2